MAFAGKRILQLILTLLLVSIFTFLAFQVIPGDPARAMLGIDAPEEAVQALRVKMGLDRPPLERFLEWFSGMLTGNPGESLRFGRPIRDLIAERIPVNLALAFLGLGMTILIGIPLGLVSARRPGGLTDRTIQGFTQLCLAVPPFLLGLLLILLFGFVLRWTEVGGFRGIEDGFFPFLGGLLLPALALGLPRAAMVASFLRGSLLAQADADYVRTAKSKGASDLRVLYRHILQNALVPVISTLGIVMAELLGGSLIVEQVFGLPGLASLLLLTINSRDFPLVQTMVVYIAAIVVFVNLLTDLLYRIVDPRIRL
ncbi:MAG: ABC transporter permease [Clostridia bacterium]|nr:ABC transporter permease [Clostridia bacterium]